MKQYYTLVQAFSPENDKHLEDFLREQGIDFDLGADIASELKEFGYKELSGAHPMALLKKYTVLIEEHELSAIMLSVGGVTVIRNRPAVNAKNKVRGMFKWILN